MIPIGGRNGVLSKVHVSCPCITETPSGLSLGTNLISSIKLCFMMPRTLYGPNPSPVPVPFPFHAHPDAFSQGRVLCPCRIRSCMKSASHRGGGPQDTPGTIYGG